MRSISSRKWLGLVLAFSVFIFSLSSPFQNFARFPQEIRIFSGHHKQLRLALPVQASVRIGNPLVVDVNGAEGNVVRVNLKHPLEVHSHQVGQTKLQLKLFDAVPIKTVNVKVLPEIKVIPGGQTIGVKLKSAGIMVVGHHMVKTGETRSFSPAERANIQSGDLIVKMDQKKVRSISEVSEIVRKAGEKGRSIDMVVIRRGKPIHIQIRPEYDIEEKSYRLGIYIRDSAAGVGTLTFYSPEHKVFGALGHVITDMNTQIPIEVEEGEIVHSNVTSISRSQKGEPGEKKAHFFKESKIIGKIEKNTQFGIFGEMKENPDYSIYDKAIPIAFKEEVQEGPAEILTVVNGHKVERFKIEIVHVSKQDVPAGKGMVIKITDPKLLEKTGGIVQGMSGSPIIQNGKLIGAVTHVFVNQADQGYGCFIEFMLQDAGILPKSTKKELKAS